ncbi:glycosyltransferase family 2 protein [Candidatus Woesearchaeota archaeon]|nr:glycosyltransferase family 2 protein [Candidatus Woesearchaeota archaeon]
MMELSIIVPLYNEEANVPRLSDALMQFIKKEKIDAEIVLVNDNSSDNTRMIITALEKKHALIRSIHKRKGNNGMGAALKTGTKKARGKFILWTMGDNSDSVSTYPKILHKLREGYDMVFGSRYMPGGSEGKLDPMKAFFSSSYTKVCKLLFGIKMHDITNAFRGFKKEVFDTIALDSNDYAISPEFSIKAQKRGFKLAEVPTYYHYRKEGDSNFKITQMGLHYGLKMFKLLFVK